MYRTRARTRRFRQSLSRLLVLTLVAVWLPACAQTAGSPAPESADAPVFSAEQLADLVAPVALYPDDLLAIVLPASTYPLQIVQAQRFVEAAANDSSLKPDADWDDSVVALLNYPDVVKLMNDDLDWTVNLGQAVLGQQSEVIAAIEGFRKRAYTAGNLRSDDRQVVAVEDQTIYIRPADPQVIYVPYYEPARMTVYHSVPAYRYYPRPYPVYYYPYPDDYAFSSGYFWGVTTFFSLGWNTHHLHAYDYGYHGHPYYGRRHLYRHDRYYYRRPPTVVNNYYIDRDGRRHHRDGHADDDYREHDDRDHGDRNHDRDRDYADRGRGDRNDDHLRSANRDPGHRPDTYWRPDYRKTGTRPGADPRRPRRQDRNAPDAMPNDPATPAPGSEQPVATIPDSNLIPGSPVANGDRSSNPGLDPAGGSTSAGPTDASAAPPRQRGRPEPDRESRRSGRNPDYAGPRSRRESGPMTPKDGSPKPRPRPAEQAAESPAGAPQPSGFPTSRGASEIGIDRTSTGVPAIPRDQQRTPIQSNAAGREAMTERRGSAYRDPGSAKSRYPGNWERRAPSTPREPRTPRETSAAPHDSPRGASVIEQRMRNPPDRASAAGNPRGTQPRSNPPSAIDHAGSRETSRDRAAPNPERANRHARTSMQGDDRRQRSAPMPQQPERHQQQRQASSRSEPQERAREERPDPAADAGAAESR